MVVKRETWVHQAGHLCYSSAQVDGCTISTQVGSFFLYVFCGQSGDFEQAQEPHYLGSNPSSTTCKSKTLKKLWKIGGGDRCLLMYTMGIMDST